MEINLLEDNDNSYKELTSFLEENEQLLPDPLSKHVIISEYSKKLLTLGKCFVLYDEMKIVGICCGYINNIQTREAFLQLLIIKQNYQGKGAGSLLIKRFLQTVKDTYGHGKIFLTVDKDNTKAYSVYLHLGFKYLKNKTENKIILVYTITNVDLIRVQKKLAEMGNVITKILDDNNIPYMITFGTLLGAVRHKGFIPWDDDFDLFLFDDSYEKAIKVLREELPKDYFVEDEKSEPLYFHGWAHIKDLNTIVTCEEYPQDSLYAHHGLSVDLYIAKKMKECELEEYVANEHIAYLTRKLTKKLLEKEIYIKKVSEIKDLLVNSKKINSQKEIFGLNVPEKRMEYVDVFPLKKYKFGEYEFCGPNNANNILKDFYGDYMILPPVEKQIPHYSSVKFLEKE